MGFLHHLIPASRAVKRILERFAGEIYEDDMFLLNDAYKGALHAPDIYIIAPIHFDAEIVAFAANFVHVTDIGAIDAGGFCPRAESSYQEGFQTPGLKIIERDKLRDDIIDTILNMSRDPELTGLDIRSQIAANQVAKRRLKETLEEFGKEDTLYVCRDGVQDSMSIHPKRENFSG
jgi:N-methylhydantoinase B